MGAGIGQPQLSAQNYVLDYQCNMLNPQHQRLFQRLGPNAHAFPEHSKGEILNEMQGCIRMANPLLVAEYRKYQQSLYGCIAALFCGFILMFILFAFVYYVGLIIFFLAIFVGIGGICVFSRKMQVAGDQWRGHVLATLQPKLQEWKSRFPAFTFTIIYPVEVWRRGRKGGRRRVAIWIYMRITQGVPQTGYNEPIFASSGQAPVQQTTNIQQTVVIQQPQQAQTQQAGGQGQVVMVQGQNGQMVAARPAMVNGQQVLVVDQPPPQQQQYAQQQPPQQQQYAQPQQQYAQPQQQQYPSQTGPVQMVQPHAPQFAQQQQGQQQYPGGAGVR